MKKLLSTAIGIAACALCATAAAEKMDEYSATFVKERMCPLPKSVELFDAYVSFSKDSAILFSTANPLPETDRQTLRDEAKMLFKFSPALKFSTDASCAEIPAEGYRIDIDENGVRIGASGLEGLVHSLKTLRQISELDRADASKRVLAHCKISDAPTLKNRMIHLCLFPELTPDRFEKYLRLAWYYKFNYVVIDGWGAMPLDKHPEFSFDKRIDKKTFKRWIDFCKKYAITPVPQVQIWGHASQSQEFSAKHVFENRSPEFANMFEPLGWTYCYSNPKTMPYLKEVIAETMELFGNPPFFHFGCDEAYDRNTCYACRKKNPAEHFAAVINEFSDFVKSRGARAIIWHDTLLDAENPAWEKQIVHGDASAEASLGKISKDIAIADWQYFPQTEFPTSVFFKSKGFDVLAAPWREKSGVYAFARCVKENGLFGFLQTTWNEPFKNIDVVFFHAAQAAWSGGDKAVEKFFDTREDGAGHAHHRRLKLSADKHFKEVESDIGKKFDYRELGKRYNAIQVQ